MKPGWLIGKAVDPPTTEEAIALLFDRLDRVVSSRLGAGQPFGTAFDLNRWRRELEGDLIDRPVLAGAVVDRIAGQAKDVETVADWRAVLAQLRPRAAELANVIDSAAVPVAPHVVYRLYSSAGALLYVGVTDRGPRRWVEHARSKPWFGHVARFDVARFGTREEAEAAEVFAIRTEHPRYNVVHNAERPRRYAHG